MDRNIVSKRDVDGERERREAAQRHKGEVVAGSGTPLTPYEERAYDSAEYWHAEALKAQAALRAISEAVVPANADVHSDVEIYQELALICKQLARDALAVTPPGTEPK